MTLQLNPKQRRFLKQNAHHLKPIMQIGKEALTPALLAELDRQLEIHELMKIRVLNNCLVPWSEMAPKMDEVSASIVQKVGHIVTLFRQRQKDSGFKLT